MGPKTRLTTLGGISLVLALSVSPPLQAEALMLGGDARLADGLRLVSAQTTNGVGLTTIQARVSRKRANDLLVPQHLRLAIVAADGTVRAEQQRVVGPAQLPRGSGRDGYISVTLPAMVAADDHVVVEWLTAAR